MSSSRAAPSTAQPAAARNRRLRASAATTQVYAVANPSVRKWSTAAASSRLPCPRLRLSGSTSSSSSSPAAVDHLRTDGFATAYTWVVAADARSRRFLAAAGWAVDGAARELDMGQPVREVRLHTDLR